MNAHGVCIRHSDLPGSSQLFVDYLYDYPRVASFFQHDPSDAGSLDRAEAALAYPAERRARVVEALRRSNSGNPSLDLLSQEGTAAVLTGQQVGLFGGPVYTLYKALSAVALARERSAAGHPTVPIFWLATEDHDVEEVRSAALWGETVTVKAASDGRPAGLHVLEGLPEKLSLSAEVGALAKRHYWNGATFGQAFLGLLKELLGPLGMLFADPLEPELRAVGVPFLEMAAEASPRLSEALATRSQALAKAGYHAQVHFERGHTSLFFRLQDGVRRQLKFDGERYSDRGETWSSEELPRMGAELSPNALLRPVWQDWLFPTVALIAGPGELAYFAQSEVIYRELLGRMPVMLPRAFFTVVDGKSAKILSRYRLRHQEVLRSEAEVRWAFAYRLIPPSLMARLEDTESRVERAIQELETELEAFDPTLREASQNSRAKIRFQFAKNKSKIVREVLRKDEQARRQAAYISFRLAPDGHLQERHYSMLALLSDFGLDFVGTILENIHHGCHDHHVLVLG